MREIPWDVWLVIVGGLVLLAALYRLGDNTPEEWHREEHRWKRTTKRH